MKRRHLKIYMSVYENLNMTSAAEELYISQPSVSQVIRELEKYYEVRLFERYPKRLYPTSEGDLLYKYARQITGLFDDVEKEIRLISEQGTVSVGANISAGTVLMTRYIDRFHEQYPGIEVDVRVTGSSKLTRMIYDHEIDFALMEDLVRESNLIQVPFYSDRIVFVAAPEHPLAGRKQLRFEDFADESMLLREKGVGVRDKFDLLMNLRDLQIEPAWQSSNTRALINAAKAGYGVAVLPYLLVSRELKDGSLAELDLHEADLHRNLNIVYHKDKVFNKWVTAFIDIVREAELREEDL